VAYTCLVHGFPQASHTHTPSECILILIAFPRQQWLRERSSMSLLYVDCLSCSCFSSGSTHTLRMYPNKYCFPTARMVTRTRRYVTFIRTLPLLFMLFLRLHTHTLRTYPNSYFFSTATMVTRTRFYVTFICRLLVFSWFSSALIKNIRAVDIFAIPKCYAA
jgi:hypothetical protein